MVGQPRNPPTSYHQPLMASFNLDPTLKPTVLLAGIFSGAPVDGLRPVRAARSFTEMLAKPGRTMESPFASRSVIQLITAFNAVSESLLVSFDVALIASINSFLFIVIPVLLVLLMGHRIPFEHTSIITIH